MGDAKKDMEIQDLRPSWEEDSVELKSGQRERQSVFSVSDIVSVITLGWSSVCLWSRLNRMFLCFEVVDVQGEG